MSIADELGDPGEAVGNSGGIRREEVDRPVTLVPPRLKPGDRVRLVSPASPPSREQVEHSVDLLASWGLEVEIGDHAFDHVGYLAGTDENRIADMNAAFRDPGVRAIFATRGGKGAYRISDRLDFEAARSDPKPLVGFSDITMIHLALWRWCRLGGIHGFAGQETAETLYRSLFTAESITVCQDPSEVTAAVSVDGRAAGFLMGGNLGAIRGAVGAELPRLDGAILLIEDNFGTGLGQVDRELTQLMKSGSLDGVRGVAVGQFSGFDEGPVDEALGGWTIVDVLQERLATLDVPVLGGLPIGHGSRPMSVPLGVTATIDTGAGILTVDPGVASGRPAVARTNADDASRVPGRLRSGTRQLSTPWCPRAP
ncbi:LD-carboxypeptidase [Actinobacteria bacterium YIM 96077]|uniref:LD-carboxypeptidase n=1 Tax=Phytoactinopolyspora halophila TaxID=1981511 RepID=A0A329R1L7_9ACTN|nr:LD-carboxypeptidase [Phytoactinopolyspora halophila]AYY11432.1 LD-carboxypeptidase [Actinobacteria bacterium YIM 96077]RAW18086.1 LD-carboxypeptidase [Phytoactinopolyspora halophila]